jgi:hypothetical protein
MLTAGLNAIERRLEQVTGRPKLVAVPPPRIGPLRVGSIPQKEADRIPFPTDWVLSPTPGGTNKFRDSWICASDHMIRRYYYLRLCRAARLESIMHRFLG